MLAAPSAAYRKGSERRLQLRITQWHGGWHSGRRIIEPAERPVDWNGIGLDEKPQGFQKHSGASNGQRAAANRVPPRPRPQVLFQGVLRLVRNQKR